MNNSNGTNPPPDPSSSISALDNAGTETYFTPLSTQQPPATADVAPFTTFGDVGFPTLTDTVHAQTENCFTYLPSISVQGSPSEVCDCGTTTAALTVKASSTGCALSNSILWINQPPAITEVSMTSPTSAPIVTSKRTYSRGFRNESKLQTDFRMTADPTRAFEIMFMSMKTGAVPMATVNAWSIYSHSVGQATKINACNEGFWQLSASDDASTTDYPTALGPFTGVAPAYSGCMYQGPSTAVGSVSCPGMPTWTACSTATAPTQMCDVIEWFDYFMPQVGCEF